MRHVILMCFACR